MHYTICLITNELYPVTHGGCGTLIYNSIYELLNADMKVLLLADIKKNRLEKFSDSISHFKKKKNLKIINVNDFVSQDDISITPMHQGLAQSWRFYCAIRNIIGDKKYTFDMVEFPDYLGYAYYSLSAKMAGDLRFTAKLIVRFHVTIELINSNSHYFLPDKGHIITYGIERWCLNRADYILSPSGQIENTIKEYYGLKSKCHISKPSLMAFNIRQRKEDDKNIILFYSRLAPQKGAELFILSAINLLKSECIKPNIRFVIAGPDLYQSPDGGNMESYFNTIIPKIFSKYFDFSGYITHSELMELLSKVIFSVFPSRQESFCYSAREISMAGVPLIVSDIPAFEDLVDNGCAIKTELCVNDLTEKMFYMLENGNKHAQFTRYSSDAKDFLEGYKKIISLSEIKQSEHSEVHILVIIFCDELADKTALNNTIVSIGNNPHITICIAKNDNEGKYIIRGKRWRFNIDIIDVPESVCFLMAGDIVDNEYFQWAIKILATDKDIGVVGCLLANNNQILADDIPWDTTPELLPFHWPSCLRRCVIRCDKDIWIRSVDPFMYDLHETSAIWLCIEKGYQCLRNNSIKINCMEGTLFSANMPMSIKFSINRLISFHENQNTKLRIPDTLKYIALSTNNQSMDLIQQIKTGATPEIEGVRFNITNLIKMIFFRLSYRKKHFKEGFIEIFTK